MEVKNSIVTLPYYVFADIYFLRINTCIHCKETIQNISDLVKYTLIRVLSFRLFYFNSVRLISFKVSFSFKIQLFSSKGHL